MEKGVKSLLPLTSVQFHQSQYGPKALEIDRFFTTTYQTLENIVSSLSEVLHIVENKTECSCLDLPDILLIVAGDFTFFLMFFIRL